MDMRVPRASLPAEVAAVLPPSAEAAAVVPQLSAEVAVGRLPSAAEEVEEQPVWVEGAAASAWLPVAATAIAPALEAPGAQHWSAADHRRLLAESAVD